MSRAILVLAFFAATSSVLAQTPAPGGILKDLERSLPTQPLTAPDGAKIDIPDAPALSAASGSSTATSWSYSGPSTP